jgi:hypothetical protein
VDTPLISLLILQRFRYGQQIGSTRGRDCALRQPFDLRGEIGQLIGLRAGKRLLDLRWGIASIGNRSQPFQRGSGNDDSNTSVF